ncbi:MAG: DUF4112 domain-containing protein [Gammaproteobacteria bacterium]|nr:DUF4112 domain-containing protein [Gammaproteobacteria bacterium]
MPKSSRVITVDSSGNVQAVEDISIHKTRERLRQLAWLLDSSIAIPGTRLTIGVDALIGLLPILGDLIGALLSSYIIGEAARLGAPKIVLMRMAFNVGVDGVVGAIPFAGDVFDVAWKANQRNVRLLNDWLDRPTKAERSSRLFGLLLVLAGAMLLALFSVAMFLLLRWIVA